ncbi:MAG: alanine racemase [Candidatus Krumholzibacteriota bacterium]|nr:alanine racemase [Candidatus Krumholzibacteriota bacterium]
MQKLPTWVDIDLDALVENLKSIRKSLARNVSVLLTVKADAYGHGSVQVAQAADEWVDWYGVATLDEARELRKAEVRKRILILSPILEKEIPGVVDNGFATTVSSPEFAASLAAYAASRGTKVEVHVEVDTGMGRTGFFPEDAEALVSRIVGLEGLRLGGVFTHYPTSDADPEFTRDQARRFLAVVDRLKSSGVEIPLIHSANSAALAAVPETHMQMVRPGLVAYGHLPAGIETALRVRPVMSWKSRLVELRRVPKGTPVSYGRTFTATRDTLMGIVPVGYGHGYPFRLSNKGRMIVGGALVPVIGRVTMDMTMVDLTDLAARPAVGDEVILMGKTSTAEITVADIAGWAGTISYEIMCGISKRVPRMYLRGGRIETFKSLLGVLSSQVNV